MTARSRRGDSSGGDGDDGDLTREAATVLVALVESGTIETERDLQTHLRITHDPPAVSRRLRQVAEERGVDLPSL